MIFNLMVRYLGLLKHIPLVPWIADALMMLWNYAFNPGMIDALTRIEDNVSAWKGITTTIHKYGGLQFNCYNKEIGHVHSNGVLDVLLPRQLKQNVVRNGLAQDHHTLRKSGWVSFYISCPDDSEKATGLLRLGYEARYKSIK